MSFEHDILSQYSQALAERAQQAAPSVVGIRGEKLHALSGLIVDAGLVVTSEQSLAQRGEFEVVLPGGAAVAASLAGRDASTNIALLRLVQPVAAPAYAPAPVTTGALALVYGTNGQGGLSARTGTVSEVGPAWSSSRGGHIERRIALDLRLSRREEGGPVFAAAGGLIGMSAFGPRGQALVIPAETLKRVAAVLARDGRIARGWLGIKLQRIAVPDGLQPAAGQSSALMAMAIADDSPAARAGILAGDIVLSIGSAQTSRVRHVANSLGADSIGKSVELRLIRGGEIQARPVTVGEQPA
jgi:S1-C subfamily serine protease